MRDKSRRKTNKRLSPEKIPSVLVEFADIQLPLHHRTCYLQHYYTCRRQMGWLPTLWQLLAEARHQLDPHSYCYWVHTEYYRGARCGAPLLPPRAQSVSTLIGFAECSFCPAASLSPTQMPACVSRYQMMSQASGPPSVVCTYWALNHGIGCQYM